MSARPDLHPRPVPPEWPIPVCSQASAHSPWRVAAADRRLLHPFAQLDDVFDDFRGSFARRNDLDLPHRAETGKSARHAGPARDNQSWGQKGGERPHQAHGRDRVEVVQREEALLALVRDELGNLAHAETARVARKDGVSRSDSVEPLEQVLLRLEVFDDRFDDQVGRGGGFLGRSGRRDVGKDAVNVVLLGGGVVGRLFARDTSQGFVDDGASCCVFGGQKAEQSFFVSARCPGRSIPTVVDSSTFPDLSHSVPSGERPQCPLGVL